MRHLVDRGPGGQHVPLADDSAGSDPAIVALERTIRYLQDRLDEEERRSARFKRVALEARRTQQRADKTKHPADQRLAKAAEHELDRLLEDDDRLLDERKRRAQRRLFEG